MVCLDMRPDSRVGRCVASKVVAVLTGLVQLAWQTALLVAYISNIARPGSAEHTNTSGQVFTVIVLLLCMAFSALLLVGLFKERPAYIAAYLIFVVAVTALYLLATLASLFSEPGSLGAWWFLSNTIIIMLNVVFYFFIRNYYLALISRDRNPRREAGGNMI